MIVFLRILAVLYFFGGVLHGADLLDLRLKFSEMGSVWKIWIIYLAMADLLASIGLWRGTRWGVILFIIIAVSQLVAYSVFQSFFGEQSFLIVFHIVTLAVFSVLYSRKNATQKKAS